MWKVILLLITVVAVARSQESTAVEQCVYFTNSPLPLNTYIEGCITPPCLLPQLQDVVLHIIFQAPRTIRSMTTTARALLFGNVGLNHDLGDEATTCNFLTNTYCPLMKDEVVQYTLRMYIEPTFLVGTAVTVEFRIVDENGDDVMCIRLPIRIVAAINPSGGRNSTSIHEP